MYRKGILSIIVCACFVLTANRAALAQQSNPEQWEQVIGTVWVHGVTAETASLIGPEGVPFLLDKLADPNTADRANVVAFLGKLGGSESVVALVKFLENPPKSIGGNPTEDRAALIASAAIADIARRGNRKARRTLLALTAHGRAGGDTLKKAGARRSNNSVRYRDDLVEQAVFALARSGRRSGFKRLHSIASGKSTPSRGSRDLRASARAALGIYNEAFSPRARRRRATGTPAKSAARVARSGKQLDGQAATTVVARTLDSSSDFHNHALTFSNHVDHNNPISDSRVDQILSTLSTVVQTEDFSNDNACCNSFSRKGSGTTFGSPGDGLDTLDTSSEVSSVLSNSSAHAKVVRAINYCGSAGSNIIGCGWVGAKGFAVVRYGTAHQEAVLWGHEYGHNVGLQHNGLGTDWIMNGGLGSSNRALTAAECNSYHNSTSGIAERTTVGSCCQNAGSVGLCEPGCGNGFKEAGEDCDGNDLGSMTCETQGFDGGALSCNSDCTFNTGACTVCGDGNLDAGEECDGGNLGGATCSDLGCNSGSPTCTSSCTIDYGSCAECPPCNFNGVCETGENCDGCPADCSSSSGEPICGDGVCEPQIGENCLSCPADCAGKQNGKPSRRYCCGNGAGENPVSCNDARCTTSERSCGASSGEGSCCGDGACTGTEDSFSCELDCGAPPSCKGSGEPCNKRSAECCPGLNCGGPSRSSTCR